MITRPALRLDPPVPAHHRGRGHHHRAPHHRLARRDRLRCPRPAAPTGRPRPSPPAPARPAPTPARPPSPPGQPLIPTGDLHPGDRGPGRDRVERHAEAPGKKIGFDTGSSTGSLHPFPARHAEHARSQWATHQSDLTQRDRRQAAPDRGRNHSSPWHCCAARAERSRHVGVDPFVVRCCVEDGGFVALRRRPAGGGVKPPRAALAEDRRGERRGKGGVRGVRCGTGKANASEPLMKCRKRARRHRNRGSM